MIAYIIEETDDVDNYDRLKKYLYLNKDFLIQHFSFFNQITNISKRLFSIIHLLLKKHFKLLILQVKSMSNNNQKNKIIYQNKIEIRFQTIFLNFQTKKNSIIQYYVGILQVYVIHFFSMIKIMLNFNNIQMNNYINENNILKKLINIINDSSIADFILILI